MTSQNTATHKETWKDILTRAYDIFDDLESRSFGPPPFSLGGGTVLMFHYKHRLSKDIDFFGYDVQWLSLVSPRLNERAASLASSYLEQANSVKIVTTQGDIDFIIAADVTQPVNRKRINLVGRQIELDPPSEILAKKLYYRAATFQPRDVYDMSAAIDINPRSAKIAALAAAPKKPVLLSRLEALQATPTKDLLRNIVPYGDRLEHSERMVDKVIAFIKTDGRPGPTLERKAEKASPQERE